MESAAWDAIASARGVIDASLFARGDYINSPSSVNEFWEFFQRFHAAKSRRPQRAPDADASSYNPKHRINFEINAKRKPAPEDAAVVREAQYALHFFEDFNQKKRLQKAVDIGAAQQVRQCALARIHLSRVCRRCPSPTAATKSSACWLRPTFSWSPATPAAASRRSFPSTRHFARAVSSPLANRQSPPPCACTSWRAACSAWRARSPDAYLRSPSVGE